MQTGKTASQPPASEEQALNQLCLLEGGGLCRLTKYKATSFLVLLQKARGSLTEEICFFLPPSPCSGTPGSLV